MILLRVAVLAALASASLFADVTYTKSIRYTGGTMLGFLRSLAANPLIRRMVGGDLEAALDDQAYTVYVSGSKMAQVTESGTTIYDLDANTITSIDNEKQSYSVETFADLRAQIERAQQWMKHPKTDAAPFDLVIEKTDQTRTIDGRTATKTFITLTAQSGNAWGRPVVNVTSWLVPVTPATRQLYEFSKRAADKLSSVFTVVPSFFGAAGIPQGSTAADAQKLNGISVLDEIAVTGVTSPLAGLLGNRDSQANRPAVILETQSSNFSSAPIGAAKFAVPAGYRQEQQRR